jgi:hypothetical protein
VIVCDYNPDLFSHTYLSDVKKIKRASNQHERIPTSFHSAISANLYKTFNLLKKQGGFYRG